MKQKKIFDGRSRFIVTLKTGHLEENDRQMFTGKVRAILRAYTHHRIHCELNVVNRLEIHPLTCEDAYWAQGAICGLSEGLGVSFMAGDLHLSVVGE